MTASMDLRCLPRALAGLLVFSECFMLSECLETLINLTRLGISLKALKFSQGSTIHEELDTRDTTLAK